MEPTPRPRRKIVRTYALRRKQIPEDLDRSKLLTVAATAMLLNYSEENIRVLIRQRKITAYWIGKRWRIDPDSLEGFSIR